MRAIESLSSVTVAAADPVAVTADYERLLEASAVDTDEGHLLQSANIGVIVRAARPGEASGLCGMTFGVRDPVRATEELRRCGVPVCGDRPTGETRPAWLDPAATLGLPIGLVAHEPREAAAVPQVALDHVVIRTDDPERAIAFFGGRLGLDMRLDRTNPAWKARLIFFRCGDLVVEVVHSLDSPATTGRPDAFGGLSWRVPDLEGLHARLSTDALPLSPIRPGRRPGSRVSTLRAGTGDVPTILMGLTARDA